MYLMQFCSDFKNLLFCITNGSRDKHNPIIDGNNTNKLDNYINFLK